MHLIFCNRVESLETRISNYMMILENYITILPKKVKPQIKIQKFPKWSRCSVSAIGSNLEVHEVLVFGDSLESTEGVILVLETDVHEVIAVSTTDDWSGVRPGAERFELGEGSQIPKNLFYNWKIKIK